LPTGLVGGGAGAGMTSTTGSTLFFIVRTLEREVCCVKAAAAWPRDVTGTCHAAAGVSAHARSAAGRILQSIWIGGCDLDKQFTRGSTCTGVGNDRHPIYPDTHPRQRTIHTR
jgi:hypothetical protein